MGEDKIVISVKTARLERDTDTFGSMEPYCKIKYEENKIKTKVDSSGGKNPNWDETFTLEVGSSPSLTISVWDSDTFSNEEIGTAVIQIDHLKANGGLTDWLKLSYQDKNVGEVYVEIIYVSKDGHHPAPHPAEPHVHDSGDSEHKEHKDHDDHEKKEKHDNEEHHEDKEQKEHKEEHHDDHHEHKEEHHDDHHEEHHEDPKPNPECKKCHGSGEHHKKEGKQCRCMRKRRFTTSSQLIPS